MASVGIEQARQVLEAIPVILVSGFLGAGKTTLMRRLIESGHARGLRLSVIVNEFGVADVDGNILRQAGSELIRSVAGGCACCSGQDDFLWALADIGRRRGEARPDVILVEASGLADPILMLDAMTVAALLPLVRLGSMVGVVDHAHFLLRRDEIGPLLKRQLLLADLIVLNKIDIAFQSQDRGTRVAELVAELREMNPHAVITPARGCAIDLEPLWARVLGDPTGAQVLASTAGASEAAHAHYQTVVCPLPHPIERARLESALQELPPNVWRCKGFVRLQGEDGIALLQYSGGREGAGREGGDYEIAPFRLHSDIEPPMSLVFIGPALDRAALLREFGGYSALTLI